MASEYISRKDAKDKHCAICEHLNICYQYDSDDCRTYTGRTCIERQCFNAIPAADVVGKAEISDAVDEVLDFLDEYINTMPYHVYSALHDIISGIRP